MTRQSLALKIEKKLNMISIIPKIIYIQSFYSRKKLKKYKKKNNLLSSHLESYLIVLLKGYSLLFVVKLKRSPLKITVSALVNSATVPEYKPGSPPGFPCSTQTAVLLSAGSKGHFATPGPIPGMCSFLAKCVKFAYKRELHNIINI